MKGSIPAQFAISHEQPATKHQMTNLGRSNKIWCPYADEKAILETFGKEQKERTRAAWRRANEAKIIFLGFAHAKLRVFLEMLFVVVTTQN